MKRAIDILFNYIVNGGVGRNGGEIELIQIPLEDFDAAIERGLSIGLSSMNFERDAETKAPGIVYRLSEYSLGNLGHFTIKRVTQRS
ncbi:MAG: hypothetical protein KDF65_06520, partial [Anaerolineae bacterium]|nr:hypothetical protein [Anaerolineae bacterium]